MDALANAQHHCIISTNATLPRKRMGIISIILYPCISWKTKAHQGTIRATQKKTIVGYSLGLWVLSFRGCAALQDSALASSTKGLSSQESVCFIHFSSSPAQPLRTDKLRLYTGCRQTGA